MTEGTLSTFDRAYYESAPICNRLLQNWQPAQNRHNLWQKIGLWEIDEKT
jgi:hypothetical protein